jgi:hypothetical protein
MPVTDVVNSDQFRHVITSNSNIVVFFYVNEYRNLKILEYLNGLSKKKKYVTITFLSVDFVSLSDIVSPYNIYRVPYLIFIKNGKVAKRISDDKIKLDQNPTLIEEYLDIY